MCVLVVLLARLAPFGEHGSSSSSTRYQGLALAMAVPTAVRTRSEACLLIHLFFLHDSKFVHTQNRFPKDRHHMGLCFTAIVRPPPSFSLWAFLPLPFSVPSITRSAGSCRVFDALLPYATHRAQVANRPRFHPAAERTNVNAPIAVSSCINKEETGANLGNLLYWNRIFRALPASHYG